MHQNTKTQIYMCICLFKISSYLMQVLQVLHCSHKPPAPHTLIYVYITSTITELFVSQSQLDGVYGIQGIYGGNGFGLHGIRTAVRTVTFSHSTACLSICVCRYVHLSICMYVCLSVCLSVRLSVYYVSV